MYNLPQLVKRLQTPKIEEIRNMSETLSFRATFNLQARSKLEKEPFTGWPTILWDVVAAGRDSRHFRAKNLTISVVYKLFFPYRKWLIFSAAYGGDNSSTKVEIVDLEIHTDHANIPLIKSRVFPEGIAGGAEFVGLRYFDAVDVKDQIKQLTGIYFTVEIKEPVEA